LIRRTLAADALVGLLLFATGCSLGWFASRHFMGQPLFYQGEFGPAVMLAAGRGFVNPVVRPGTALARFLTLQQPTLNAEDVAQVEAGPIDQLQKQTTYLMRLVGYEWKLTGISWRNVAGVSALMFGLTLAVSYGVARVLAQALGEIRDAIFAPVGQRAIRNLALEVFGHLHGLSLRYHLERQTGGLSRVIERGTQGMEFLIRFTTFNILPTVLEIGMVGAILFIALTAPLPSRNGISVSVRTNPISCLRDSKQAMASKPLVAVRTR